MATRFGARRLGVLIALLMVPALLVLAGQVSTAQEQPATNPTREALPGAVSAAATPVPGGPGFYSLSGYDFKPRTTSGQTEFAYGARLYNPETSVGSYVASLDLPHGATINKLGVFYYDNYDAPDPNPDDIRVFLRRIALVDGNDYYDMAAILPTGKDTAVRYAAKANAEIASPLVDRQSYAYMVSVSLPPTISVQLVSVRVDYSFGAYLPQTVKP